MDLSIVIPVYNEQENLENLYKAIQDSVNPLPYTWELIFIDDGSTDKSVEIIKQLILENNRCIQLIELRRNYGQTAALAAGIEFAQGGIVVLLDADMQNDPGDIPLLLNKLEEGFDVVSGWRKDRKDKFVTRIFPSRLANKLISSVTGLRLHDYGCTLKAYRREYLTAFHLYGEMHRFIPVYAQAAGARVTEVAVTHHPRKHGKSHYGIDRTLKVILDLVTVKFLMQYSAKPMRLFGGVGLALMGVSLSLLLFLAVRRIFWDISVLNSPFFQISILGFILGFQSILMGLIAELLIRTYYETQGKSTYAIRAMTKRDPDT